MATLVLGRVVGHNHHQGSSPCSSSWFMAAESEANQQGKRNQCQQNPSDHQRPHCLWEGSPSHVALVAGARPWKFWVD